MINDTENTILEECYQTFAALGNDIPTWLDILWTKKFGEPCPPPDCRDLPDTVMEPCEEPTDDESPMTLADKHTATALRNGLNDTLHKIHRENILLVQSCLKHRDYQNSCSICGLQWSILYNAADISICVMCGSARDDLLTRPQSTTVSSALCQRPIAPTDNIAQQMVNKCEQIRSRGNCFIKMNLNELDKVHTVFQKPLEHEIDQNSDHAAPSDHESPPLETDTVTDEVDFESLPDLEIEFEEIPEGVPFERLDGTWGNLRSVEITPLIDEDANERIGRLAQILELERAQ